MYTLFFWTTTLPQGREVGNKFFPFNEQDGWENKVIVRQSKAFKNWGDTATSWLDMGYDIVEVLFSITLVLV